MSSNETPYLKYGLGYEEDERAIGNEPFHQDVLDLVDYFVKKYPNERWSIMHNMFQIGFNCGQRSMDDNNDGLDEILKEAEIFCSNINTIVIEMEQIAHSMDFALEHIETLDTKNGEHIKAASLLEVLIRGLSNSREISADLVMLFEQFIFKTKQKNKPTSSANEVSEEK